MNKLLRKGLYLNNVLFLGFLYSLKFLGSLIFRGKKKLAYKLFSECKYNLKLMTSKEPSTVIFQGLLNITPKLILYKKRFGAQKKEIPMPIFIYKGVSIAVKSVFKNLKAKKGSIKVIDLVNQLLDALAKKGDIYTLIKKKYEVALRNRYLLKLIKR